MIPPKGEGKKIQSVGMRNCVLLLIIMTYIINNFLAVLLSLISGKQTK